MRYRINFFTKIEYDEKSQEIHIYGKKLQKFFNIEIGEKTTKIIISVEKIKNVLYVKPSFTKGYFEIQYNVRNKERWFQTTLSKSFWYGAEQIFEKLKIFKHINCKNYFSKTSWKKQELKRRAQRK